MAYAIERKIINDVQAPRWLGYETGASHALLIPEGESLEGRKDPRIQAACGTYLVILRLHGDKARRCKWCAALFAEVATKANAGLSEPQVEIIHTGAQQGSPREAERKVAADLLPISGDAVKVNPAIVELLRAGDRKGAMEAARDLDACAAVPSPLMPKAQSARAHRGVSTQIGRHDTSLRAAGQRDEARTNGVAMVQGANMAPAQPMRRIPRTARENPGALVVSSIGTMGGGLGRERPDSEIVKDGRPVEFKTRTQRRNWQRKQRAAALAAENAALLAKVEDLTAELTGVAVVPAMPRKRRGESIGDAASVMDRGHVGHYDLGNDTPHAVLVTRESEIRETESLMRHESIGSKGSDNA